MTKLIIILYPELETRKVYASLYDPPGTIFSSMPRKGKNITKSMIKRSITNAKSLLITEAGPANNLSFGSFNFIVI